MKRILATLLALMLMLTAFAGCSGTTAEKSPYAEPAFKVGDTEYSIAEYNYMYMNSFNEIYSMLYQNYSSYISYIIDIAKPLEEQNYSDEETWDQYITNYTEETLRRMTVVYEAAKADKDYVMSDEFKTALDEFDANVEANAADYDMTVDEFIKYAYGETADLETVRAMTEKQYTYYDYSNQYESGVEVTDEEMKERYESDKKSYDSVDFRYFAVPYVEDGTTEFTAEQKAQALITADALAKAKDAAEFEALVLENAGESQKEYYSAEDSTLYKGAKYGDLNIGDVADWLFDDARTANETYISESDESACVYVFMFENRTAADYSTKNVRHILLQPEKDEEGNSDDAAWSAVEKQAQELYDSFLAGEHTEEIFASLANENSSDTGSNTVGGLYENVAKGKMVDEFEDWCYDESRKTGDTGIVKTTYGYHIMYYVGDGDNALSEQLYSVISNEKYEAWIASLSENTEFSQLDGYASVGKFVDDVVAAWQAHAEAQNATPTDETSGTESTESTDSVSE